MVIKYPLTCVRSYYVSGTVLSSLPVLPHRDPTTVLTLWWWTERYREVRKCDIFDSTVTQPKYLTLTLALGILFVLSIEQWSSRFLHRFFNVPNQRGSHPLHTTCILNIYKKHTARFPNILEAIFKESDKNGKNVLRLDALWLSLTVTLDSKYYALGGLGLDCLLQILVLHYTSYMALGTQYCYASVSHLSAKPYYQFPREIRMTKRISSCKMQLNKS